MVTAPSGAGVGSACATNAPEPLPLPLPALARSICTTPPPRSVRLSFGKIRLVTSLMLGPPSCSLTLIGLPPPPPAATVRRTLPPPRSVSQVEGTWISVTLRHTWRAVGLFDREIADRAAGHWPAAPGAHAQRHRGQAAAGVVVGHVAPAGVQQEMRGRDALPPHADRVIGDRQRLLDRRAVVVAVGHDEQHRLRAQAVGQARARRRR